MFDVGETLVDESATYERWNAEGATTFVFATAISMPTRCPV